MLSVQNVKVYDLVESVIASGYAMRTEPLPKPLSEYDESSEEFKRGIERLKRLVKASSKGNVRCHDNALTGIRVSFDVTYPQYWTPEAQRYHFFDIVTSASKMHRLMQMDLDKCCNKYVTQAQIDEEQRHIDVYNEIANSNDFSFESHTFCFRNGTSITDTDRDKALYHARMFAISNCPLGLELFERVSTNYKQLQTIYWQRHNHTLQEDWVEGFCNDFILHLPYATEFILGE